MTFSGNKKSVSRYRQNTSITCLKLKIDKKLRPGGLRTDRQTDGRKIAIPYHYNMTKEQKTNKKKERKKRKEGNFYFVTTGFALDKSKNCCAATSSSTTTNATNPKLPHISAHEVSATSTLLMLNFQGMSPSATTENRWKIPFSLKSM